MIIKNLILSVLALSILASCDKSSMMDANINNSTSQDLIIIFVSSTQSSKIYQIKPNETILFQDDFSSTGGFLKPSLVQYDSIFIQNAANEILKIFKENTDGKNIYNVDGSWMFDEPSDGVYKYDYKINNEDFN